MLPLLSCPMQWLKPKKCMSQASLWHICWLCIVSMEEMVKRKKISTENIGNPLRQCFGEDEDPQHSKEDEEASIEQKTQSLLLKSLNDAVDDTCKTLPDSIWTEWLWHTDPMQECHMDLMLNRMHLLGLIIARYRAKRSSARQETMTSILGTSKRLWLFDGPVARYTLRQLTDTLQNLQVRTFLFYHPCLDGIVANTWNTQMQWNTCHLASQLPSMRNAVDAMFLRFGALASETAYASSSSTAFDDPGSIEKVPGRDEKVQLNRICIRRMVSSFFVLYRHMHCWEAKEDVDGEEAADCAIKLHHILAASDDFSKLSMHWDLMPGAKLHYVHDFRGLFNCISQVIYFHNPSYERRMQERKRVEDVSCGKNGIEMVQLIPCFMQLHPDILVEQEDTRIFQPEQPCEMRKKWAWLIMGRTVYLCTPWEDEEQCRILYYHQNAAVLLHMFRRVTGVH